jgi:hypothetical protein
MHITNYSIWRSLEQLVDDDVEIDERAFVVMVGVIAALPRRHRCASSQESSARRWTY